MHTITKKLYDAEEGSVLQLDDDCIRLGFLRQLFGVLTLQMVVVMLTTAYFMAYEHTRTFVENNPGTHFYSIVLYCRGKLVHQSQRVGKEKSTQAKHTNISTCDKPSATSRTPYRLRDENSLMMEKTS